MCETVPQATSIPANTGSRCGLGCILAREHVNTPIVLPIPIFNSLYLIARWAYAGLQPLECALIGMRSNWNALVAATLSLF